ncbi:MAG TPA: thioesterase family protein [Gemmatimonadota bacterium]|nr:thioesterase family protein [Gemmatimonadota bacterium]
MTGGGSAGGGATGTAIEVRVRYAETDQQGVAYHGHYFVWMEIARTEYLKALGFPYDRLEKEGLLFAVSEASCRYAGAARYEDTVRVEARVTAVRSRAVTFEYEISVAGAVIAEGRTTLVAMDADRRARRIPAEIAAALDPGR